MKTDGVPAVRERGSEVEYRNEAMSKTTWLVKATRRGFLLKPKASQVRYTVSGAISKVNRRFFICPSDKRIGACHCSTMSNSVQVGGVVGNFTRQAWVALAVFPFANVNFELEGIMVHSIPYLGASFIKASRA